MSNFIYLDHNILSEADKGDVKMFLERLREEKFEPLISHIHLLEIGRGSQSEKYLERISKIKPALLRISSEDDPTPLKRILTTEYDAEQLLRAHKANVLPYELGLFPTFGPMVKLLGGFQDVGLEQLYEDYIAGMKVMLEAAQADLTIEEKTIFSDLYSRKIEDTITSIRNDFSQIDFHESVEQTNIIRNILKADGGLHQCPEGELVQRVSCLLSGTEASEIFHQYPENFARDALDPQSVISSFSMILYGFGAVPKASKILSGTAERQYQRLIAQFLDNQHIGEAIVAAAFLTADKSAARLAKAVYMYAGIGTAVFRLEKS